MQMSWRQVGVPQRHRQRLVAEQLLHAAEVRAAHHEAAREGVAEVMPGEILDLRVAYGRAGG